MSLASPASAQIGSRDGGVPYYGHVFPVQGAHGIRGAVGETGNAAGTGCHLHFEIHVGGVPIDPEPSLRCWDRYSRRLRSNQRSAFGFSL